MSSDEREALDAILEASRDYLDADSDYREKRATYFDGDDPSAGYRADCALGSEERRIVEARERFGEAMGVWLKMKLAGLGVMTGTTLPEGMAWCSGCEQAIPNDGAHVCPKRHPMGGR